MLEVTARGRMRMCRSGCHLCLRYAPLPMSPGRTLIFGRGGGIRTHDLLVQRTTVLYPTLSDQVDMVMNPPCLSQRSPTWSNHFTQISRVVKGPARASRGGADYIGSSRVSTSEPGRWSKQARNISRTSRACARSPALARSFVRPLVNTLERVPVENADAFVAFNGDQGRPRGHWLLVLFALALDAIPHLPGIRAG